MIDRGTEAPVWLTPESPPDSFPPIERALKIPEGLLAVGGDLSPERLLAAYRRGIFPWYQPGQPILWWSPDPRTVLFPTQMRISRNLGRVLRRGKFELTMDEAFADVVAGCAAPRRQHGATWITAAMATAYTRLFALGFAHSVEVWQAGALAGGLYGVALGGVFFGESMFTRVTDASKVALAALAAQLSRWDFGLIDCQVASEHLASLGSKALPRPAFAGLVERLAALAHHPGPWCFDTDDPAGSAEDLFCK